MLFWGNVAFADREQMKIIVFFWSCLKMYFGVMRGKEGYVMSCRTTTAELFNITKP